MTQADLEFPVTATDVGERLDLFLAGRLNVSRGEARRLLSGGVVRLNKRVATEKDKGLILREGSVVTVDPASDAPIPMAEPDLPFEILAQSEGWVVINKPSHMPVHPLDTSETGTVLNAAVARYPSIVGVGEGGLRCGVVHRLDVETSGTLVLATTQEAWEKLRDSFHHHRTDKLYRVIVIGKIKPSGMERMWLVVGQHKPAKVKAIAPPDPETVSRSSADVATGPGGARLCDLTWKAVEWYWDSTLIEVRLGTGFMHQIRAMMSAMGNPVMGDDLYGGETGGIDRPMLHASQITIEGVTATAPDPEDFAAAIAARASSARNDDGDKREALKEPKSRPKKKSKKEAVEEDDGE